MSRQSPECFVSPVAGSPDGRLFTLSYWKISPPLIRKILAIRPKIIVSHFYCFVEMGPVMCICGRIHGVLIRNREVARALVDDDLRPDPRPGLLPHKPT
jgi:hypothetical protein